MAKRLWIILGIALSAMMLPAVSQAACTLNGVIVRVTAYDDSYSTIAGYIYFRPTSLASYYYYVYTNDDEMINNAIASMNSGRTLTISGDVGTCPATPAAGGAGYLGLLRYFYNP